MSHMSRRHFIGFVGAVSAVSAVSGSGVIGCGGGRSPRPNLLLITVDELRSFEQLPGGVGLPNFERVRSRGTSFREHTVAAAPCTPARCGMYTGVHAPLKGMYDNTNFPYIVPLAPTDTLGTYLRALGFYTAYKGKWHLSDTATSCRDGSTVDALEEYGFADYNACGDYHGTPWAGYAQDEDVALDAADWLATRGVALHEAGTPFCLSVNFVNPHDIMFLDTDGTGATQRAALPVLGVPRASLYQATHGDVLPRTLTQSFTDRPSAHAETATLMDGVFGAIPTQRDDLWSVYVNYYLNCIRDVDRQVGVVLDALERTRLDGNTVIVLVSDHGELAGAHGLRQKGPNLYRENVNVPLVVSHPDARRPREVDVVTSAIDLIPTMLGLVGATPRDRAALAPDLVGIDHSAVVTGGRADPRRERGALFTYDALDTIDAAFGIAVAPTWAFDQDACFEQEPDYGKRGFVRGVYDGAYRFARYFAPNDYHRPADLAALFARNDVELYDVTADRDEVVNLASEARREEHAALIERMRAKLEALIDEELGADVGYANDVIC